MIKWLSHFHQSFSLKPRNKAQIIAFLRKAQAKQLLNAEALTMMEGVMHVSTLEATEIMVPRSHMVVIKKSLSLAEITTLIVQSTHSRFPVIGENKDEIVGILHAKDLLSYSNTIDPKFKFDLKEIIRPAIFVPGSKKLDLLLKEFKASRNHLAIVVDEYGSISGLLTIEDVLEQIVGEIEDEHDDKKEVAFIQRHTDHYYSVQALTPVATFNDYFNSRFSLEDCDTIGGVVLQAFARLPSRGESILINNIEFSVLNANNRRIRLLGVKLKKENLD